MKPNRQNKVSLPLNEAIKRDLVFFYNPILIQGLALTPAIAATTTLKNSVILSIAIFLIVTPTRLLSELLLSWLKVPRIRAVVYVMISGIIYIPAFLLLDSLFGTDIVGPGIYLPMLAVDGLVISRFELPTRESAWLALKNGLNTSLGAAIVLLLLGAVREILSLGTIYGVILTENPLLSSAGTIPVGIILVAVFAAAFQCAVGIYKREHFILEAKNE